jgi:hypothetical protein
MTTRGGRRGERGAALVESAIVLPIILVLAFGIIEFGIAFDRYLSLRAGVREATRLAVVGDLENAPECEIAGTTVTPPESPETPEDATAAIVCKAKDRAGNLSEPRVLISMVGPDVGEYLTLCMTRPVESITNLFSPFLDGRTLRVQVTMRLEQEASFTEFTEAGATC